MNIRSKFLSGFTLVEMAVVLVILGLLLGGLLLPLSAQLEQQRRSETRKILEDAKEALQGYAITNNHLPCPDRQSGGSGGTNDTANDGVEDFTVGGACATQYGNLPWSTLGIVSQDGWGTIMLYKVTAAFSDRTPLTTFSMASAGTLRVCNERTCAAPRLTDTAAAVIFSLGPNEGFCSSGACLDELENTDTDNDFVSHIPTANGSGNTEYFDDLTVWISEPILKSKMVSAGKLP